LTAGILYGIFEIPKIYAMKKFILTSIAVFIISAQLFAGYNSKLADFLYSTGAKELAGLAHPTNTFASARWEIEDDYVYVYIEYGDDYKTNVKINISTGWFTKINVTYDNDFFPPFLAIEGMKDLILELLKDDKNKEEEKKRVSDFEKYLNKKIEDMTGKELACLYMNLIWFDYYLN
jgi:hypothetical protein